MKTSTTHEAVHLWATIATFNNRPAAQAFCDFLRTEGFESRVADERKIQRFWFLAAPKAGIHVEVPEDCFGSVREALDDNPRADSALRDAIRCPSCRSTRVQYPQMTRKFILPTLVAQSLVLVGVMKHECYCEDCHYTWVPDKPANQPAAQAGKPVRARA
jgi:formate-dependent nitrite reductase cytochrome c552 subunit